MAAAKPVVHLSPAEAEVIFEELRTVAAGHWGTHGYQERLRDLLLESLQVVDADQLYRDAYAAGKMHAAIPPVLHVAPAMAAARAAYFAHQAKGDSKSMTADADSNIAVIVRAAFTAVGLPLPPDAAAAPPAGGT